MDRSDLALTAIRRSSDAILAAAPFFPAALRRRCDIVTLKTGHVLPCQTEGESAFYRLLAGDVSVQLEVMGEGVTVQRAAPGDWLVGARTGATAGDVFAVGERKSTLLRVPAQAFDDLLGREPRFARAWCAELGAQMVRMQRRVERLSFPLARRIEHYLATESVGGCGEIELPFPKRVWAAHLGMASESLSRALAEMMRAGRLEKAGRHRYRLLRIVQ